MDMIIPTSAGSSLGSRYFPNIESFPGQLLVTPPSASAKQETRMSRAAAVRGARHLERQSPYIWAGLDRSADMVVGARITVHPTPDWELLGFADPKLVKPVARQMLRAFNSWAYDSRFLCDAEGDLDFGGLMRMAFRNAEGPDAETFGIIHTDIKRRKEYNTPWATFIQVIDPDRVSTPPEMIEDRTIIDGLKLDRNGRWLGFHCSSNHPAEGWDGLKPQFSFIPRETWWGRPMSWHWFDKRRGGQHRGITRLATVIKRATKMESLDDSTVTYAAVAALLGVFIKTRSSPQAIGEALNPAPAGADYMDKKLDYYDHAKLKIGQQRIPVLAPDDDVQTMALAKALADPTAFRNNFLREYALVLGQSFEQVSANFSDANYSASRAALLEAWRGVVTKRLGFTSSPPSQIYSAVIEEAIEIGAVVLPEGVPGFQQMRTAWTSCSWTGPGMGQIDPLKEANAMLIRLKARISTRQKEAAAVGDDFLEIFDQIEREEEEAAARGFSLDIDAKLAAAQQNNGSGGDGSDPKPKKKSNVQGDGDGDGLANEDDNT